MFLTMLLGISAAATFAGPTDDKAALLEKVRAAYANLETLSFEIRIKEDLSAMMPAPDYYEPPVKRTLDVRVLMAKGGKFRIEAFEDEKPIASIISNGQDISEWVAAGNCWTRYAAPSPGSGSQSSFEGRLIRYGKYPFTNCADQWIDPQSPFARQIEETFKAAEIKLRGTAKVDGCNCDVLRRENTDTFRDESFTYTQTWYFGQEDRLLRKETLTSKGTKAGHTVNSGLRSWLYRNIRPNAKLPEDAFTFTPPEGSTFIPPDKIEHRQEQPPSLDGQPAPAFTLPAVKGGKVSLADFKDQKPVLLVFWATWCRPCRQEMPMLIKLHREFGDQGLAVIGVSTDGKMKTIKSFLKGNPLPYPILHDATGEVSRSYFAGGIPYTVLIDKSGKVVKTWRGWGGEEEEREIRAELAKLGLGPPAASRPTADAGE